MGESVEEVVVFEQYQHGDLSAEAAAQMLVCARSTFFRRLRHYQVRGTAALVHRARGKPKSHFAAVKAQVVSLYQSEPSLFCSFFYRRNHSRFQRHVAYSTARKWLRDAKVLRRYPRGTRLSREMTYFGIILPSRPLEKDEGGNQPQRIRRNCPWQVRERHQDIWRGWERPLKARPPPSRSEWERFAIYQQARRDYAKLFDIQDTFPIPDVPYWP